MTWLIALLMLAFSTAITVKLMPRPKLPPMRTGSVIPLAPPPPEPEYEFDPLAFWLFPDWDGPIDEPFWMRPPLEPIRYTNRTNYGGMPMMYGRVRKEVTAIWHNEPMTCETDGHDLIRRDVIGGPSRWRCLRCGHESESTDVWE